MKHLMITVLLAVTAIACTQSQTFTKKQLGGPCEDCQLMFDGIPETLQPKATLALADEPGERLIIRGVIFQQDGKTPAADVILYVYHTDNQGNYSKGKNQRQGIRHGHLRGWMKTNAQGEYEFKTIRPASYPNSNNPQHIHPIIHEPGKGYYWIDEYLFEDDPKLTTGERAKVVNRGGSGIIKLTKNDGTWYGTRNIVLGQNVY